MPNRMIETNLIEEDIRIEGSLRLKSLLTILVKRR